MNVQLNIVESIITGDNTGVTPYVLGLYFFILLIIFIVCYIYHICKRNMPTDDYHSIRPPEGGLTDDVLDAYPTFVYSRIVMSDTDQTKHRDDDNNNIYGSGCSICLAEYKPTDVVRLLPECGHLFHVSCVDTWLKVHPTCPVCRNSLDFMNRCAC